MYILHRLYTCDVTAKWKEKLSGEGRGEIADSVGESVFHNKDFTEVFAKHFTSFAWVLASVVWRRINFSHRG